MRVTLARRLILLLAVAATSVPASAQRGGGGGAAGGALSAQASAPFDLTGYWVSIVNEDWRWRMVTPPKGDYASIANLMTASARKLADSWDVSQDGSCLAYGAAAVMRMPTRVHVTWENANTLKVETDAGQQTRRFVFNRSAEPPTSRSLQGYSIAEWEQAGGARRGGGPGPPPGGRGGAASAARGGSLKVVTTSLTAGWLRRNGVPYSERTTVTEYYDHFMTAGGDRWFVVTTVVSDPEYLTQDFVTSSHFRREPDGTRWAPAPCRP